MYSHCQCPVEEGPLLILRNPFEITTQIMKLSVCYPAEGSPL